MAETLERLRALGPACAAFLEQVMDDPRSPVMAKVIIAREVFDRAGWPRRSEQSVDIGIKAVGVKFLEINHAYEPPAGWNGAAVEAAEAATAPWLARPFDAPPALPAAASPTRVPARAPTPPVAAADVHDANTPSWLAAAPRSEVDVGPTSQRTADDAPGASGALEVVNKAELRRRQAERDARELERLSADDDSTFAAMDRASRGW